MKRLITLCLVFMTSVCWAAPPSRVATYTTGTAISSTDVTANEDALFNYMQAGVDTIKDNTIVNADVNSSANIQSNKLNLTAITQNLVNTGTLTNTGNGAATGRFPGFTGRKRQAWHPGQFW